MRELQDAPNRQMQSKVNELTNRSNGTRAFSKTSAKPSATSARCRSSSSGGWARSRVRSSKRSSELFRPVARRARYRLCVFQRKPSFAPSRRCRPDTRRRCDTPVRARVWRRSMTSSNRAGNRSRAAWRGRRRSPARGCCADKFCMIGREFAVSGIGKPDAARNVQPGLVAPDAFPAGRFGGRGGRGSTSTKTALPFFQIASASSVVTTRAPRSVAGVGVR